MPEHLFKVDQYARDLNNTDKHRMLVLVTSTFRDELNINVRNVTAVPFVAEDGTKMVRAILEHDSIVDMQRKLTRHISFAQFGSIKHQPVIEGLTQLVGTYRDVVTTCAGRAGIAVP